MTLLYRDPVFQEHDTGNHPEHARRLVAIEKRLAESDLLEQCRQPACPVVDVNHLTAVHTPEHIATVESYAQEGGGRIEVDTVVSRNSYDAAARAAGTVCDAVNCVVAGEASNAMCLVRPPGHHALRDAPMGFCLFNNIAVGARLAIDHLGLNRVLVIDWDVHHGNGTQASFWTDPQIAFFSIHRFPFYPGTGDADETGSGDGLGTTLNLPVSFGTPVRDYLTRLETELTKFADKFQPELVLLSAGFDAHAADPVGSLGLASEDFQTLTKIVLQVAGQHCGGKLVSALEGGYNPTMLAESVELHLGELVKVAG